MDTKEFRNVRMSDLDEGELMHYGVKGMKWGVRKDRKTGLIKPGSVLRRAPIQRRDDLMKATATKSLHTRATFQDQSDQLKKIYKSARPKIKAGLKKLNADPKYSGVNLNEKKNKKLREDYNKEVSRVVTDQLNAASYVKTKRKDPFAVSFEYRSGVSEKPIVSIAINDKKTFRDANRKWAKETRKSVKHSEDDSVVKFEMVLDKNGFVTDLVELTSMAHFDDLGSVLMSDLEEDSLSHYGVKGMKWGVRKDRRGAVTSVVRRDRSVKTNEYDDKKVPYLKTHGVNDSLDGLRRTYKKAQTPINRGLKSLNSSEKYATADLTDSKSKIYKQYHKDVSNLVEEKLIASAGANIRNKDNFVVDQFDYDSRKGGAPKVKNTSTVGPYSMDRDKAVKDYHRTVLNRHNTDKDDVDDAVKRNAAAAVVSYLAVGPIGPTVVLGTAFGASIPDQQRKRAKVNEDFKKRGFTHSSEDKSTSGYYHIALGVSASGHIGEVVLGVNPEGTLKQSDILDVPMSEIPASDVLMHFGVKGMKWGVRRSRSAKYKELAGKGGKSKKLKLTSAQKERIKKAKIKAKADIKVAKINAKAKKAEARANLQEAKNKEQSAKAKSEASKKKPISAMSNQELQEVINRHNLETQYKKITEVPKKKTNGEKARDYVFSVAKKQGDQVLQAAIKSYTQKQLEELMKKAAKK